METELFVHFAEIAGVFVGFGALISQRSARPTDLHDVVYLRAVLALGVWVVIAALVPIVISRYGADGHGLWVGCAVFALIIWAAFLIALGRTADSRLINRSPEPLDQFFPVVGLPLHVVIAGSMVLVILGVWPDNDEALYATGIVAGVVFAAYTLLALVLSQGRQPAGQDESTKDG